MPALFVLGALDAGCSAPVELDETGVARSREALTWSEVQTFAPSDAPVPTADFKVALSGKTAIVGVVQDDDEEPVRDQGAAYIFARSHGSWSETQKLSAPDALAGDHFGRSVALDGATALIGATEADGAVQDQGAAYVFVKGGSAFAAEQKLVASDGQAGSNFGFSTSLSGNRAAVGANGAAYVFRKQGSTWSEEQKLERTGGTVPSLALVEKTLLAGYLCDSTGCQGSVSVYERGQGSWVEVQRLVAADGESNDRFGSAVALHGTTAFVGAPGRGNFAGAVYVFTRSGSTFTQTQVLTASDAADFRAFGNALSLGKDRAFVTSVGPTAAYAFSLNGSTWSEDQALVTIPPGQSSFGQSVALAKNTGMVGIIQGANSLQRQGTVHVFLTP
jgi:hypothetical protein